MSKDVRKLRLVDSTELGDRLALYGDLVMHYHVAPSIDESLGRFLKMLESGGKTRKRASLLVIGSAVRPPGPEVREQMRAFMSKWAEWILAAGLLVLGNPLNVAMHRASLSRMRLQLDKPYPANVLNDTRAAAEWLAGYLYGYTVDELLGAIRDIMSDPPPLSREPSQRR